MEGLFEYNDYLNSPYEAFIDGSEDGNKKVRPHWHYYAEFIYVISGSANINSDNESYTVREGDMAVFLPRSIHSIESTADRDLFYYVIKFDINCFKISSAYTPELSKVFSAARGNVSGHIKSTDISDSYIERAISQCVSEYENKTYGYDLLINCNLTYVLVNILRLWRRKGLDTDKIVLEKEDDSTIYNITEYIDENSKKVLNIQNLAKMCNMSYSYFAREFKRLYGRSCKDYIEFVKISKAEQMLMFTDFDLNYISAETGFSDSSHLIKTFKKLKGITPKQFKKNRIKT